MEAISEYLEKNKMSQAQFGEKLGVGQAMVGNWLSRRRGVSLDKALEIEKVFGINANLLNDQVQFFAERFEDRRKKKRNIKN